MAFIRKKLTNEDYTKADNKIVRDGEISDAAVRLYWYLAANENGFNLNDCKITSDLGWSQAKVTRNKKVLRDNGFLLVDKIDRRTYIMYIGSTTMSAEKVKEGWKRIEEIK